jgi:hypothetical protein
VATLADQYSPVAGLCNVVQSRLDCHDDDIPIVNGYLCNVDPTNVEGIEPRTIDLVIDPLITASPADPPHRHQSSLERAPSNPGLQSICSCSRSISSPNSGPDMVIWIGTTG